MAGGNKRLRSGLLRLRAQDGGCGGYDGHDGNDGNNGVDPFGLDCYNDGWCDRIGCEECSPQDIEYPGRPCARQCRKYGLQNHEWIRLPGTYLERSTLGRLLPASWEGAVRTLRIDGGVVKYKRFKTERDLSLIHI